MGQGTIPDEYKVDHLVLLVGGNPLPNAVAGKLLLKPGGRITLLHSPGSGGTGPIADRLIDWFTSQGIKNVAADEANESDGRAVFNAVTKHLGREDGRSGLNYTGGTKTMSVYAYDALKSWAAANNKTPFFSYLDARTLQMVFEDGRRIYTGQAKDLSFTIESLFELQDWLLELRQKLSSHNEVPSAESADKGGLFEIKTGEAVWGLRDRHNLSDFYMNIHARLPDMKKNHAPEYDVVALRGYQIFFFSCSTAKERRELKVKLFEATIRARQIGGDEACVALVCQKTLPFMEKEAQQALGATGRIKVFHGVHQNNLQQHISDWIKQQSKEELA